MKNDELLEINKKLQAEIQDLKAQNERITNNLDRLLGKVEKYLNETSPGLLQKVKEDIRAKGLMN
jgi:hypothetical protein